MEKFILGMLQEQLGKVIVGFRKEMVNASLLNGKGEITDLNLNCSFINEQLSSMIPYVELDSCHISRVAFQVSSWTNLRKAPIMVDIEHITVHMSEPLHYTFPRKRQRIRQMTVSEMEQHFADLEAECKRKGRPVSNPNKRGGYNIMDRIADNICIEIKSIYIQFQTWGKFKTRRPGPWTPPLIQIMLRNLRYCSVDEFGNEGTPEDHWAHNNKPQPRGQERTVLIFKQCSLDYDFGLTTLEGKQYSLLKGGRGVRPPQSTTLEEKEPSSPTAAETVAALSGLGGPAVVATETDPKAAAEAVAALALGESQNAATGDEGGDSDDKDANRAAGGPAKKETAMDVAGEEPKHSNMEGEPAEAQKAEPNNTDDAIEAEKTEADGADDTVAKASLEEATSKETKESTEGEQTDGQKDDQKEESADATAQNDDDKQKSTEKTNSTDPSDDNNNKVMVQMAMKRRLRDGALLAIQADTTLYKVEVQIQAEVIQHLVHAAMGLQYCLSKDRGYEDPLRHENDKSDHNDKKESTEEGNDDEADAEKETKEETVTTENDDPPASPEEKEKADKTQPPEGEDGNTAQATTDNKEKEVGTSEATEKDDVLLRLPSIALDDNMSAAGDGLSVLGDTDNDTLEGSTVSQLQPVAENKAGFGKSISNFFSRKSVTADSSVPAAAADEATVASGSELSTPIASAAAQVAAENLQVDRAIIMLPNGLVIHEKISVSVTVDRATVRGVYAPPPEASPKEESQDDTLEECDGTPIDSGQPKDHEDYIQVDSSGAVVELIWPKSNLEKGGYAQASVSHVSIQERYGKRLRTVVSSGVRHGVPKGPIEIAPLPPIEVDNEETFPKFEDRAIREDPLGIHQTYPAQAMGLVAQLDCQTRKKAKEKLPDTAPLPTTITMDNENNDDAVSATPSAPNTSQDGSTLLNISQDESSAPIMSQECGHQEEQTEEDVEVIVVNNELGVEHIDVVLDLDCWCRTLRFLLNERGGGFDERWHSGDWSLLLTTDMLVHPSVPLELDDHLQPLAKFFLDEHEFVSSDLFHVNAKIRNCEMRIPAPIQHNVRSCDIVAFINETLVTVSSDLPRAFPSANVGSTLTEEANTPAEASRRIKFPNDPTDVSIELVNEDSIDAANGKSDVATQDMESAVKTKSTFRLELKMQGMSTQIIPVIPFYRPTEPQQLITPTDVTVGFSFEGLPPENDHSNLIKMALFTSVNVKQLKMNCDLELLAGATSTILHHFHVARETIARAKDLFTTSRMPEDDNSLPNGHGSKNNDGEDDISSTILSTTTSTPKIQKSLRGRGILVHRQLHRSRETGGLSLGMYLHLEDYNFNLWRQSASMKTPNLVGEGHASATDQNTVIIPLLKLISCSAKNFETGIEVSFPDDERRVVVKCGLSDASLSLCNLNGEGGSHSTNGEHTAGPASISQTDVPLSKAAEKHHSSGQDIHGTSGTKHQSMVDIIKFGATVPVNPVLLASGKEETARDGAILIRCEECYGSGRARSFAANIGTGGVINLHANQFESVFLLILETLMMPTWSTSMVYPLREKKRFPENSVGALFHALLPGKGGRFRLLKFLWTLVRLAFPDDLRLLLLHIQMAEVLITIPEVSSEDATKLMAKKCALMLRHLDLVTWYISSLDDLLGRNMFPVVASTKEGISWTNIISQEALGINHRLSCRQSFHVAHTHANASPAVHFVTLLPEFDVVLEYVMAKMSSMIDNTCSLGDKDYLRDCFSFLWRFMHRCVGIFFVLKQKLSLLRLPESDTVKASISDESSKPIYTACLEIGKSLRAVKALLLRLGKYVDENSLAIESVLKERDEEAERLRQLVFAKEKELVAAVAMASSPIAGWLRVGGTHQSSLRISTASTLWRFWAVLRKEILFLYATPGKFKPVDLVSLHGAHLCYLSGGKNKWDVKRSFGIVEASGKTRFLVVGSDDEYNCWTREIKKAMQRHTFAQTNEDATAERPDTTLEEDKPVLNEKETEGDQNETAVNCGNDPISQVYTDRDEESSALGSAGPTDTDSIQSEQRMAPVESSPGIRGKMAGIGSFFNKSKAPSTPINRRDPGSAGDRNPVEENTVTTVTSTDLENSVGNSAKADTRDGVSQSPHNGGFTSTTRRTQLKDKVVGVGGKVASVGGTMSGKVTSVGGSVGGKVAFVGQATGRWGSALIAATRQKGRDVAERSRRSATPTSNKGEELNKSGHGSLHVITEKEDERTWTCPQCTFINSTKDMDAEFLICVMCRSPMMVKDVDFGHPQESAESSALHGSAAKAELEDELNVNGTRADSGEEVLLRQSSEPLDLRDRLNSADSDPDVFVRSQSSENFGGSYAEEDERSIISDLAMDEMSEATRSVGRRRRDRFGGLLGSGRKSRQGRPGEPEQEKKGWFSRRGSSVSNQDEGEAFLKAQPGLKLKNIQINPNLEFKCDDAPAINVPLQKLEGQLFVVVEATRESWTTSDADSVLSKNEKLTAQTQDGSATHTSVKSSASVPQKGHKFTIHLFHMGPRGDKQPKRAVNRSLSEVLAFHNAISECIVDLMHHPMFHERSFKRTKNGEMSTGLKNTLGISPLDSVRISGAFLAGIAGTSTYSPPIDVPFSAYADVVMEFLNFSLDCPLSITAHFALKDLLGIPNAASREILAPLDCLPEETNLISEVSQAETAMTIDEASSSLSQDKSDANLLNDNAMSLSSQCIAELLHAENKSRLAAGLLLSPPMVPLCTPIHQPQSLAWQIEENLQSAMHTALMKVMAERDEAHAQLVSASVLHAHKLDQERKKVARLEAKFDLANKMAQRPVIPRFGLDRKRMQEEEEERAKLQKKQLAMQQDSDAEIVALCEQLSGEISSRTKAALEVTRLKEARIIEKKQEMEEKDALRDELTQLRDTLRKEQKKAQEAKLEAERWKQCYEHVKSEHDEKKVS